MKKICFSCSGCKSRLDGRGLFSNVSDGGLGLLDACTTARLYKTGQQLFREGDSPEGLHCLHSGLVKLYRLDGEGKSGFLRLAEPGYPLGYRAFFIEGTYRCSAVALEDSEICFLSKNLLARLTESEPSLTNALLKTLADDLARIENIWQERALRPVRSRVCRLLLELERLENWPPRAEMAFMLSITPEVFARTLTHLHQKGYLIRNRRHIQLLAHDVLRSLADGEDIGA